MGINVDYINNQLKTDFDQEVKRREDEIIRTENEITALEKTYKENNRKLQEKNTENERQIENLNYDNMKYLGDIASLNIDIGKKEVEKKNKIKEGITQLTLSKFLEDINFYQNAFENDIFYKGVLINSFYELEFNFPYADKDINEILRCRCVSIGVPNIRKNYTSLNFNGRRVEIEQNAEFQHEIQLKIICDDEADIYYKFKEYIDFNATKKPKTIFNNSKIYICLNGFRTIELNHITISDLGQLEFDNGPNSNICFFNVTLKIIDYKFVDIVKQNEYDKLTFEILKNKKEIKEINSKISSNYTKIFEINKEINNNKNTIRKNNETIAQKKEELEFFKNEFETYFN
jgi:predicted  nucleic acid-binding Zn-ribbon protein